MQILRQGTAEVVQFGPFVDKTDGVTLKTDATTITDIDHAATGIFVSKNGAAAAIRNAAATASVADAYGMMRVTLDTTDTDTLGTLDVTFAKAATYLPVNKEFMVIPATLYDTLFATQPAAAIKKFFDVATPTGTVDSIPDAVAGAVGGIAIVGSEMVVPNTQKVDIETIKTKAVTAGAAITINASVGAASIVPTNTQFEARSIVSADYTVVGDLGTVQSADNNTILAHADYGNAKLVRSTTPTNKLDVNATGEAGLDFDNIKDATGAHTLTNITVPVVTTNTDLVTAVSVRDAILDDATRFSGGNIDAAISSRGTADAGDAMNLAADAIKAVSYDESTAFPLKANDAGVTQVARVGADGDTLETLSDQIDDVPTVAEFNARTIVSAGYVVVGDTIAGVTTATNLTNAPSAGDLTATMKTSVNTEVLDVLNTDTFAEPGQEAPPATTSLVTKIGYLYKFLRNKIITDATGVEVYNDAGAVVDQKSTISDDGTDFTRGKFGSGP